MAHTKAIGTTRLGRDSQPKYLGVKLYDGQPAKPGDIIIRQRGTKFMPGKGVRLGSAYTIYSIVNGKFKSTPPKKVKFTTRKKGKFDGSRRLVKVVNVIAN